MNAATLEMISAVIRSAGIRSPKDKIIVLDTIRETLGITPERAEQAQDGSFRILTFIEAGRKIGKHPKFFSRNRENFKAVKSRTGKAIGITEGELTKFVERISKQPEPESI